MRPSEAKLRDLFGFEPLPEQEIEEAEMVLEDDE